MSPRTKAWLVYGGLVLLIFVMIIGVIGIGVFTRGGVRNIQLGRETTYITEPLRDDGTIDYLAAINQITSHGVDPETNAAVDFLRAFGSGPLPEKMRPRYYAQLGMSPLPRDGSYYVDLHKFADEKMQQLTSVAADPQRTDPKSDGDTPLRNGEADESPGSSDGDDDTSPGERAWEELERCLKQAWTPEEYPVLDQWLQANERPLTWIVRRESATSVLSAIADE